MKKLIALSLMLSIITTNITTAYAMGGNKNNDKTNTNTSTNITNNEKNPTNEIPEDFENLKGELFSDIKNRSNQPNAKENAKNPLENFDRERVEHIPQEFPELELVSSIASNFNLVETIDSTEYKINDKRDFRILSSSVYTSKEGVLKASSSNVNVWLIDSGDTVVVTDEMYDNILGQGQKIYDSMTNGVAEHKQHELPQIWSNLSYVGDVDDDEKINILLYDIGSDGSSNDSYIAGFFAADDMSTSNDNIPIDAFHMDIGLLQGGAYLNAGEYTSFFGTFAHEFQHMLFYSYLGWKIGGYDSTWINESLSGFTDMYYGSGSYSSTQIPDIGKFSAGLQNEYSSSFSSSYGDFFSFNNSYKNYGMGYYLSAFMQGIYGNDYIKKMYEYFDTVEFDYSKNTFTLSDENNEIFSTKLDGLYTQGEDVVNQAIFGGAFKYLLESDLDESDVLNYVYRLFMEAFISDGGTTQVNGVTINYPKLWVGDDLWHYRSAKITNTIQNNGKLSLTGYNGNTTEQATHEMTYQIPKVNTYDEILTITVGDENTNDSLYVYVALLNEDNSAELVQLTLGEEAEINSDGREAYLFATTKYNDVSDVVVKLEWEEVSPHVEEIETYDVIYNLTNITTDGEDSATQNESYTTTLTADSGYELPETVVIKMDNEQLSSGYVYNSSTGEIIISSATSDIVITATGVETDERVKLQTPTISGKAEVGEILTVSVNNIDLSDFSIQWYADGATIGGATDTTFEITTAQKGKTITVGVTPDEDNDDYLATQSLSSKTDEVYQIYEITFVADDDDTIIVETKSNGRLDTTELPTPSTDSDSNFLGWFDESDNRVTLLTTFEEDTTVTAKYVDKFTIDLSEFNSNETPNFEGADVDGKSVDISSITELIIENVENMSSLIITKLNDVNDNIITLKSSIGDIVWTIPAGADIDPSNLLDLGVTIEGTSTIALDDDDTFVAVINFAHEGQLLLNGEGLTLQFPLDGAKTDDSIKFYKLDDDGGVMNGVDPVVGEVIEDGIVEAVFTSCSSWGAIVSSAFSSTGSSTDTTTGTSSSTTTGTTTDSSSSSSNLTSSPTLSLEMYNIPTLSGMYISVFNNVILNQLINLNSIDMSNFEKYNGTFLGWYYDSELTTQVDTSSYKTFLVTSSVVENGLFPKFSEDVSPYLDSVLDGSLDSALSSNDNSSFTVVDNSTYNASGVPVITTTVPNTMAQNLARLF